jgi:thiamine-phosphate pyrophosphorylase
MSKPLHVAIISSPNLKDGEDKIMVNLFKAGVSKFHLRKPDHSPSSIARLLKKIPADYHKRIILHRAYELLNDFDLGGYHHRSDEKLKDMAGTRSRSLHKINELQIETDILDYVFFGPVFHSISKAGHKPKVSLSNLSSALEKLDMKGRRPLVYALGGIRRNKISTIVETGFDGVALLGSIWGKPDPVVAYKEFNSSLQSMSRLQLR